MSGMELLLVLSLGATGVLCVFWRKARSWRLSVMIGATATLSCLLLGLLVVARFMFPMFEAPPPTGAYAVGIMDLHLIDADREETMTADPDDRRELMVRVWYPARVPGGAIPEPFLRDIEPLHHILARGMPHLPAFMLTHLKRIRGHSYLEAPVAEAADRFPVLVFSHGNSFYASQNAALMEQLASHGYAVFAIEHPYQAAWVKFPDGRVAKYRDNWNVEGDLDPQRLKREEEAFYRALFAGDYERYRQLMTELIDSASGANKGLQIWVADTALLLDVLARTKAGGDAAIDRFHDRLDLQRIGLFGMSYGGAVAGEFCSHDARCKAGLNMDGLQYGPAGTDIRISRPFMFIYADQRWPALARIDGVDPETIPLRMNDFAWRQAQHLAYSLTIEGASHMSFSDFGLVAPVLRKSGMLGSVDPEVMRELLGDVVLAFFNQTLRGTSEPLLEQTLRRRPGVLEFEKRDGHAFARE